MKDETYQARYKTGKKSIIASGFLVLFAVLVILVSIICGNYPFLPVAAIILAFCCGAGFISLSGYREIRLYQNRMEVVGVIDGVITEIYYKDITKIGFANGHTDYGLRGMRGRNSIAVSELVILLRNGDRHMFGDDDYDHLPDACAFIEERMSRLQ